MPDATIVIAGASGVVGSRVLERLLSRDGVARVVALGRRALPIAHQRLVSRVVDIQNTDAMAAAIPGDTATAVCCLGTTMKKAGSKEAFRALDRDAVVAFGKAALANGARRFLLVSSIGARAASANFYQQIKGETEEALARLGYPELTILRPSLIDDRGSRSEYRAGERLMLPVARLLFSVVGNRSRYAPITADVIASALVRLAFDHTDERVRTVESDQLQMLGR